MAKPIIAVVDGDILAFKIAAACETRSVDITNKVTDQSLRFNNRTEFRNFTKGILTKDQEEEHYSFTDVQTPEPIEFALNTVKQSIAGIKSKCKADQIEIYISGENNFRDSLPLPKKYKSNREGMIKPVLLQEIRNYLVKYQKASVVDNWEADDTLVMRVTEGLKYKQKVIQVSSDKDARGSDGWLFDPDKMEEPELVSGFGELHIDDKGKLRGKGRLWKYAQWLMGDSTDCFNPCDLCGVKYGDKSAYKDLKDLTTDQECFQKIHDKYKEWYPEPVTYTAWDGTEHTKDYIDIAQMYWDCVHMLRHPEDKVDVREVFKKMGCLDE